MLLPALRKGVMNDSPIVRISINRYNCNVYTRLQTNNWHGFLSLLVGEGRRAHFKNGVD